MAEMRFDTRTIWTTRLHHTGEAQDGSEVCVWHIALCFRKHSVSHLKQHKHFVFQKKHSVCEQKKNDMKLLKIGPDISLDVMWDWNCLSNISNQELKNWFCAAALNVTSVAAFPARPPLTVSPLALPDFLHPCIIISLLFVKVK